MTRNFACYLKISAALVAVIASNQAFGAERSDTDDANAATEQAATDATSSTGATDDSGVGDIVVTAQKREESANKVPMSITAVSGTRLQELGVREPRDLVKLTPSLTYAESTTGTPIYTLRGVGFSDTAIAGRSTVAAYTDESPIPFTVELRGANLDLERVEILKGPQGTLFGQNATGGAINFIAAKPTSTLAAGANVSYGNYNAFDIDAFLSGPLSDTLSARIAVAHSRMDPWQKAYTVQARNGSKDFTNARLSFAWNPDERLTVRLTLSGWYDRSEMQAAQLVAITPNLPPLYQAYVPQLISYPVAPNNDNRTADFDPTADHRRDNDFIQANLRADYEIADDLTITSLSSYSRYRQDQLADLDGLTFANSDLRTTGSIKSYSQELRLTGQLTESAHFVVGVNYAHDTALQTDDNFITTSTYAYLFQPLGLGLPLFTRYKGDDNQRTDSKAIFAAIDYSILPQLKISGGIRYSKVDIDFDGNSYDPGTGQTALAYAGFYSFLRSLSGLPPITIAPGGSITAGPDLVPVIVRSKLNQHNVPWRVGVEWTPTNTALLYANVSKGFKAGSFPAVGSTSAAQLSPAVQEAVLTYETGAKLKLSRALQVNGAVYYSDYTNKQVLGYVVDPVFGPLLKLINVPKSRVFGAELQADWVPMRGLRLSGGMSYTDSKVQDNFTNFDQFGATVNFDGYSFANTPKWQAFGDAEYRSSVSDSLNAFIGGNVGYRSSANSQLGDIPLLRIKGYALVDLRAGIETKDGRIRFSVWGKNVGDVNYWTAVNRVIDSTVRFTGMPATYGVTLGFRY